LVDLADADCARLLDRDGDAYCPAGHDTNGDGDCLDFDEARPIHDCDDGDPERRPRIGETCTDGVDNDCNDLVDGFDPACGCEDDDACPVSEPCMVGRCIEDVGCQAVADPTCSDAGDDDDDGGTELGQDGGRSDAGRDGDRDADPTTAPPSFEEVGCGCRLIGARTPQAGALPLLALLGVVLLARARRRR
jgi:hypothetical protein